MIFESGVPVELCRVETRHGCLLDGAVYGRPSPGGVTFLVVHGTGGNFYSPGPLETFSLLASQAGHIAVRINTQGHDGMASIPCRSGARPGGAAFEDAVAGGTDIAGWVRKFADRGAERIVLVGHSMGGLKSLLAAREPVTASQICGVVCCSPPWLNYAHWMQHPSADAFRDTMALAREAVSHGQGDQLIRCRQPLPIVTTAAGFCGKYGPDSELDLIRLVPDVDLPVLVTIGARTLGTSPAFDGVERELERLQQSRPQLEVQIVPGEDMSYAVHPDGLFQRISAWLERNGVTDPG